VDRLVLKTMAVGSPETQISGRRTAAAGCQRVEDNAFHLLQRLSWRGFAVCQNFSNDRRKVINAGARHDDAVPAPMSFFSDTQEFTAVVLPEFDIEMLALNLQFFRLDDVVHFALRAPSLGSGTLKWKKNPRLLREFLTGPLLGKTAVIDASGAFPAMREGCRAARSTYTLVRV
jgi:hypothetical protein